MSIGASEHRAFCPGKGAFRRPKGSGTHFVHRNAVIPDILPCIIGGIFWRKVPRVPCPSRRPSVRPARSIRSRWLLPDPPRHSPPPGMSLFRRIGCNLDRPPARHGPLRHPPLPGVSRFRHFRCYLDRPHARHGPLRCPPLPGVSRFRRIGSHLRRVTQASRPGTMAAGAREQAASCDAFVLSRRLSAPEAPPNRTSTACLVAKPAPEPRPGLWLSRDCHRGTPTGAWNNAVRTRGVFTHRDDFQKLACAERGLVRTARGGTGRTGAERRKCGSGCRDRQESASWGRCGSGARLSDGNRRGRKMVARDEQKRMAGRVAWRDDVGNGNEPSQRGTDRDRRAQERASW